MFPGVFADPIGTLVLLRILFGGGGGASPVPSGPFPTDKPSDLPPWPSGWCPDLPPAPEVVARGWDLLPTLWQKGENTRTVEMVGGRYITFVATTVLGQKAVAAYRTENCPPATGPLNLPPPPMPPSDVPVAPGGVDPHLLEEAVVMNEALKVRGYKQSDMLIYKDFQAAAGLPADGYPGTVTMLKLETVLKSGGYVLAPVRIYPWKATGKYDGVNAPTAAEWQGSAIPGTSPLVPPPAPTVPPPWNAPPKPPAVINPAVYVQPTAPTVIPPSAPSYQPSAMSVRDVQHALNLLGFGPLAEDGIAGPQTKAGVVAFQRAHPPLAQDGIAGPQTKSALTAAVALGKVVPSGSYPSPVSPASLPPSASIGTTSDVQQALNRLGYTGKDGKPLTVDGKTGPNTNYAILQFQKEHPPLATDSVAGPQTKVALAVALSRGLAA